MTETILLSAYDPPTRELILSVVDTPTLRAILERSSLDRKSCLDRITKSDVISSQIELELRHVNF